MKLLNFTSLLLSAFCVFSANAATSLEMPIDILEEPNYAQTRYAISHENCKLMWIVRAGQAPSFFVREMRACNAQPHGTELLLQLRSQLLSAVQQGRPAQQSIAATEPGLAQASAIAARPLSALRSLSMGSLEQMPHWQLALQQALAADVGWRTARSKLGRGQSNLALEKRLIEIANRDGVFADLAKIFENTGYTLRLRNIEKLRFLPDGRVMDCQLFFMLIPPAQAQSEPAKERSNEVQR